MGFEENLQEDHEALRDIMVVMESACDLLVSGRSVDRAHMQRLVAVLGAFLDHHFSKEEDVLFPEMERSGLSREGVIEVMLEEHKSSRTMVKEMEEERWDGEEFPDLGVKFLSLMNQHMEREEEIVFPMAELRLPEERKTFVLEEFKRMDRERIRERTFQTLVR